MKKYGKILSLTLVFAVVAFCCALVCGCGESKLSKYDDNISELRERIFAAEDTDYKITAISGRREDPYEMNGVSGQKRDFTVITVTPTTFSPDKNYRYRAEIGESAYEGDLLPHPFARSLSADIPCEASGEFSLTITCGADSSFCVKPAETGELITCEKAFSIALDKLDSELKRFRSKGKLNAEIYVRLVENPIDGSGGYFWYVAFVGEGKETVAVLLKGDTGAVSALRV